MAATTTRRLEATQRFSTRTRYLTIGVLVLLVLCVAIALRLATEPAPALVVHRTVPAYVRIPGRSPALAWPNEGQAAVEVEGVGSFGAFGGSTPVPIASVAKVMTAYLTLRDHPLPAGEQGFTLTITRADVAEEQQRAGLGQSTLSVKAGERITERQALEALLLPSANNIAALLAVHDAGSSAAFVARMNSTARKLGMRSTTYTDPSGFEHTTVSTATDQLKLATVAIRQPALASIVDMSSVELPVAGRVANYDGLVGSDGYVGVKTGSDAAAGGCLVFAKRIQVDGRRLTVLGVVLGQHEGSLIDAALTSARQLGDSAASSVGVRSVLTSGTKVLAVRTVDGRQTTAVTATALDQIGWPGLAVPVRVVVDTDASARARAGEQLATVRVGRAGSRHSTRALATRSLGEPSLGWRLRHLL